MDRAEDPRTVETLISPMRSAVCMSISRPVVKNGHAAGEGKSRSIAWNKKMCVTDREQMVSCRDGCSGYPQLSPSSSPYFNTQSLLEVIVGSPSLLLVRHWVQDGSRHRVGTRTIILCADPVGGRSC